MKKRILSVVLALCLSISSQSMVYAWQEEPFQQENVFMEEDVSRLAARSSVSPAPAEVYEAMIALKDQPAYKEGTTWTNDVPYSSSKGYYWKGGTIDGKRIHAVGCVAFAFILSDAAFDSLPARMYAAGGFNFEDIKPGDILRLNNDTHTVIVLDVIDAGVVIAEGNMSTGDHKGKVHWGRTISREEVMRSVSHYITRYPQGYVPPNDPTADTIVKTETFAGGFTWTLTKAGTMTISGKGAMPDFSSAEEQPWNSYSSQIRKIIIENGITSIGSCAFWNCGVLSAEIPSSVTTIGNSAFRQSSIISATLPASVKTIGDSAFYQCQNLSSVSISEGVETIGQNAFQSCTSLTSIALPASIEKVGSAAFFQCREMTSAVFASGNSQVKLGDNLFTQCYYLTNVTLPRNIDRIGEGMFQNCGMLAGVEIPKGAESIGNNAFASCFSLTTVIIPDSVMTIGAAAFSACSLKDIYFTGTEAQWKSIGKIGDTAAAVSKATIHYNYIPMSPPDSSTGDDDNDNSGDDSGNGNNTGNGDSSENRIDISRGTVTLSKTSYTYDGKAKTPSVTVKLDGKTLVLNTDYTVLYNNNIKIGTAKVTVTGKGKYIGSKTVHFAITKKADQNPVTSITCKKTVYKVVYGTKPFKIKASSESKMTFTSSKPKIVSVDKKTGKVTIRNTGVVTITIKAGKVSKNVTVKVSPKKQSAKSIKTEKGRKLTVKWMKDKMASKYQIQISTDKKFKKSVKSKSLSNTSYTFSNLKKGKKYYVRVRSYKKSGKEILYGPWSKIKLSNKIKK